MEGLGTHGHHGREQAFAVHIDGHPGLATVKTHFHRASGVVGHRAGAVGQREGDRQVHRGGIGQGHGEHQGLTFLGSRRSHGLDQRQRHVVDLAHTFAVGDGGHGHRRAARSQFNGQDLVDDHLEVFDRLALRVDRQRHLDGDRGLTGGDGDLKTRETRQVVLVRGGAADRLEHQRHILVGGLAQADGEGGIAALTATCVGNGHGRQVVVDGARGFHRRAIGGCRHPQGDGLSTFRDVVAHRGHAHLEGPGTHGHHGREQAFAVHIGGHPRLATVEAHFHGARGVVGHRTGAVGQCEGDGQVHRGGVGQVDGEHQGLTFGGRSRHHRAHQRQGHVVDLAQALAIGNGGDHHRNTGGLLTGEHLFDHDLEVLHRLAQGIDGQRHVQGDGGLPGGDGDFQARESGQIVLVRSRAADRFEHQGDIFVRRLAQADGERGVATLATTGVGDGDSRQIVVDGARGFHRRAVGGCRHPQGDGLCAFGDVVAHRGHAHLEGPGTHGHHGREQAFAVHIGGHPRLATVEAHFHGARGVVGHRTGAVGQCEGDGQVHRGGVGQVDGEHQGLTFGGRSRHHRAHQRQGHVVDLAQALAIGNGGDHHRNTGGLLTGEHLFDHDLEVLHRLAQGIDGQRHVQGDGGLPGGDGDFQARESGQIVLVRSRAADRFEHQGDIFVRRLAQADGERGVATLATTGVGDGDSRQVVADGAHGFHRRAIAGRCHAQGNGLSTFGDVVAHRRHPNLERLGAHRHLGGERARGVHIHRDPGLATVEAHFHRAGGVTGHRARAIRQRERNRQRHRSGCSQVHGEHQGLAFFGGSRFDRLDRRQRHIGDAAHAFAIGDGGHDNGRAGGQLAGQHLVDDDLEVFHRLALRIDEQRHIQRDRGLTGRNGDLQVGKAGEVVLVRRGAADRLEHHRDVFVRRTAQADGEGGVTAFCALGIRDGDRGQVVGNGAHTRLGGRVGRGLRRERQSF